MLTKRKKEVMLELGLEPSGLGVVVAVIVWQLDLQLPMQSVPITNDAVSSNLNQARCTTLCDKVCQWLATDRWFSMSSTNTTDRHDITEILLKISLYTIKPTNPTTNKGEQQHEKHVVLQKRQMNSILTKIIYYF